ARVLFRVKVAGPDTVTVEYELPITDRLGITDPDLSDPNVSFTLNCTSLPPGLELMLVADPIMLHMQKTGRPLNGPAGSAPLGAGCVEGGPPKPPKLGVSPSNLPKLAKAPAAPGDIIGIYDGGGFRN